MEQFAIAIEGDRAIIREIEHDANHEGVTMSKPVVIGGDPLNAPISAGDLQNAIELITVIISSASAGVAFFDKLFDLVQKLKHTVVVKDPATGKRRGAIGSATTREQARRIIGA
jgi:hypothetical protein